MSSCIELSIFAVVIGQGEGVVAEQSQSTTEVAVAVLRSHARNQGLRLAEVTRDVVLGTVLISDLSAPVTDGGDISEQQDNHHRPKGEQCHRLSNLGESSRTQHCLVLPRHPKAKHEAPPSSVWRHTRTLLR